MKDKRLKNDRWKLTNERLVGKQNGGFPFVLNILHPFAHLDFDVGQFRVYAEREVAGQRPRGRGPGDHGHL